MTNDPFLLHIFFLFRVLGESANMPRREAGALVNTRCYHSFKDFLKPPSSLKSGFTGEMYLSLVVVFSKNI